MKRASTAAVEQARLVDTGPLTRSAHDVRFSEAQNAIDLEDLLAVAYNGLTYSVRRAKTQVLRAAKSCEADTGLPVLSSVFWQGPVQSPLPVGATPKHPRKLLTANLTVAIQVLSKALESLVAKEGRKRAERNNGSAHIGLRKVIGWLQAESAGDGLPLH